MPSINAGNPVKFENGGTILIGADDILSVREGTLSWQVRGLEPIPHMDRGVLIDVYAGNQRPCSISLDIKYTAGTTGMIGTGTPPGGFLSKILGALTGGLVNNRDSAGKLFTFSLTVRIPDGLGVATGDQYVWAKCYLPDGVSYSAGSGADFDTLSLTLESFSPSPTMTRF